MLLLSVVTAAGATSEQLVVGRHRGQWPGVRRQVVQLPLVQERHGRRRLPGGQRRRGGWSGFVLGLGGFAGLQGDRVRGQGPGPQRGRQTGDQVLVRDVPGHQEHLDQGPGALGVAVCFDRCGPPGVMDRGELAGGAGLLECGRAGEGAWLADQGFEVVVQFQAAAALGDQPLVAGHFHILVVNHQVRGVQHHPDPLADQPHRHRVAVGADRDLAIAVDARREHPSGLERLLGQRHQQRPLDLEVLVDRSRPGSIRRRPSCWSHCSTSSFSSDNEATSGTGVKWLRRK